MGLQVIEGTWEEIKQHDAELAGQRFRLIPLAGEGEQTATFARPGKMIAEGMFPQLAAVTDDDFKAAEFHGDPKDGLDWT